MFTAFDQTNTNSPSSAAAALEMELQHHLEMEHCYTHINSGEIAHEQQEIMGQGQYQSNYLNQIYAAATVSQNPPASLLASLGLLADHHFTPSAAESNGVVYDPLSLFHSLPSGGAGVFTLGGSSFTADVDNGGNVGLYQNGDGVFQFTATETAKDTKSEKQRRLQMKDKYELLRSLVPNPSKDRASIVADAIVYINELKRTVTELKGLVERKRCARERLKRPKIEEISEMKCEVGDMDGSSSSLRSSWLHRKTKNTEVDVRIIHDEVTVKVVQQKRINCLLFVSKVLDELQLDLHHVAGGLIGDYYSYLFNSKIGEGSTVYASAVAEKLIEVVDKEYATVSPATNYN